MSSGAECCPAPDPCARPAVAATCLSLLAIRFARARWYAFYSSTHTVAAALSAVVDPGTAPALAIPPLSRPAPTLRFLWLCAFCAVDADRSREVDGSRHRRQAGRRRRHALTREPDALAG
eukprot:2139171-Pleurochrysis_carterae.AAC.2